MVPTKGKRRFLLRLRQFSPRAKNSPPEKFLFPISFEAQTLFRESLAAQTAFAEGEKLAAREIPFPHIFRSVKLYAFFINALRLVGNLSIE